MRRRLHFPETKQVGAYAVVLLLLALPPVAAQSTSTPLSNALPEPEPAPSSSVSATDVLPPAAPAVEIAPAPARASRSIKGAKTSTAASAAQTAATLARLAQSNGDLLDLLKKQQAVLEDIQYDRRLQNRQIASLEERLQAQLEENSKLQTKIARLEDQISLGTSASPAPAAGTPAQAATPGTGGATPASTPAPAAPTPPATYLPPPESAGEPGTKSWHRLFTLSGSDSRDSEYFHVTGPQWRVLWHNQDQPGAAYANTSALFISAFPKGDTIPQKVCSKLGSGGDSTELTGPGDFYLKVEASGGDWELAVEDFR